MARRAAPHLIEGTLLPLGLFYLTMWLLGIWGAIAVSLTWSWGIVAIRLATHRRVPGLVLVGALALSARSLVSYLAASEFIYFLQPTLATVVLAAAFLFSAPSGRPLAERLAHDFLPMPGWFASHPVIRRFFIRITVLWGAVQLASAGLSLWLLVSQPVPVYLITKTAASTVIMGAAVWVCTLWFRRLVERHGLSVLPVTGDSL